MDDLIGEFIDETIESLAQLDAPLDRLKTNSNDLKAWQQIYDVVHMIKGTCGFAALPRLELLSATLEHHMDIWMDNTAALSAEQLAVVFQAIHLIKAQVDYIELHAAEQAGDDAAMIAELNAISVQVEAAEAGVAAQSSNNARIAVNDNGAGFPAAKSSNATVKTKPQKQSSNSKNTTAPASLVDETWLQHLKQEMQDLTDLQKALLADKQASNPQAQRSMLEQAVNLGNAIHHDIVQRCPLSKQDRVGVVKRATQTWVIAERHIVQFIPLGDKISTAEDQPIITVGEHSYPLLDIPELIDPALSAQRGELQAGQFAVLCRVQDQHFAILADEVLDVGLPTDMKPPPPNSSSYILGTCALADASIAMVLNLHSVATYLAQREQDEQAKQYAKNKAMPNETTRLLLFSIREGTQQALLVDAVDSVITVDVADIEIADHGPAITYQGVLIRLTSLPGSASIPEEGQIKVILLNHSDEVTGLAVSTIIDIVEYPELICPTEASEAQGLGASQIVIDGVKTDIINAQQVVTSDQFAVEG